MKRYNDHWETSALPYLQTYTVLIFESLNEAFRVSNTWSLNYAFVFGILNDTISRKLVEQLGGGIIEFLGMIYTRLSTDRNIVLRGLSEGK